MTSSKSNSKRWRERWLRREFNKNNFQEKQNKTLDEFKDYGKIDFTDHELELVEKQIEKTNEQLEELGI